MRRVLIALAMAGGMVLLAILTHVLLTGVAAGSGWASDEARKTCGACHR
ncbi:MAG: hypothetical protein U1E62_07905 [Alsobacter sp.]